MSSWPHVWFSDRLYCIYFQRNLLIEAVSLVVLSRGPFYVWDFISHSVKWLAGLTIFWWLILWGLSLTRDGTQIISVMRDLAQMAHFRVPPGPLFQKKVKFSAFDMEMIFHSHANKTHLHKKDCALGLI